MLWKIPNHSFGKTFDSEIQKGNLNTDYSGKRKNGELIEISLFGTDQIRKNFNFTQYI